MEILWDEPGGRGPDLRHAAFLPLQQSEPYGAALRALGAGVRYATIRRGGEAVGRALVISRRWGPLRLSLLSRGPVWREPVDPAVMAAAFRCLAREAAPLVVTAPACRPGLPLAPSRQMALLDLTASPEVLRARMATKWRNRLRRAEGAGLSVCLGLPMPADVAALLTCEARQQRARGYRALPPAFTHAWLAAAPDRALLAEAAAGGTTVARMLFLLHPPGATYHIGWSGPEGRRCNAHNLLLWRAALCLRDLGVRTLDLGGADPRAESLARFKLGSGAVATPLGPTRLLLPWG